jgi:drug/metabolite transporter (DMT)-like permease
MDRHIALILFLALVWSASFMAIKIGVDTISPLSLTAGRVLIAAIILYAVASFLGYKLPMEARFWGYCLAMGYHLA